MPSLFLCPEQPLWQPGDVGGFADFLRAQGMLGTDRRSGASHEYSAGESFLKFVMFLGCSPEVALDPESAAQGRTVCAVRLVAYDDPVLLVSVPPPAVRCACCRAPAALPANLKPDAGYRCGHCGNESAFSRLDWRQGGGYGRFFLEISGIYPHEALPSDKLLLRLESYSRCKWTHFYAHDPSCRTL